MSYRIMSSDDPDRGEVLVATLQTYDEARIFAAAIAWMSPRIEAPAAPTIHVLEERVKTPARARHSTRLATA